MECRYFYIVYIRDPIEMTYHRKILAKLKGDSVSRNRNYCKGLTTWPILKPKGGPIRKKDAIFYVLRKEFKKPTRKTW